MSVNIVTKEDLLEFRHQLLLDLKSLLNTKPAQQKQWLRGKEVRKLLNISSGTLQNLRVNGTLSYSKIGSIYYYNADEINAFLNSTQTPAFQQSLPLHQHQSA